MIYLEDALMENIKCNNRDCALHTYREIIFQLGNLCSKDKIRSIKNYLIFLNSFLYGSLLKNTKSKLHNYHKRNKFNLEIEGTNNLDKLIELGENIIFFYMDINSQVPHRNCTKNPIVNEAIRYIHLNFHRDISLGDISKSIHISKNHLSFLFAKCLDTTFSEYLNRVRINKGKVLLTSSNLSILNIAMECGFNSQSYFCSVFKRYENMTPKRYRDLINTDSQ